MPLEPIEALSFELRSAFLQGTMLQCFMAGMHSLLVVGTFFAMATRGVRAKPVHIILILVLYALPMTHTALDWNTVRLAFVVHGETSDTVLNTIVTKPLGSQVTSIVAVILSIIIADCVMIWRCWVVWNKQWLPTIIPVLLLLVETAFSGMYAANQVLPGKGLSGDRTAFLHSAIIYFMFSLATNVTSTSLIIIRIVMLSKAAGTLSHFSGVIEMIVESSVMYALIMIVYVPMTAVGTFNNAYPQAILIHATGIIPTLILARVALGYTRPQASWSAATTVHVSTFYAQERVAAESETIMELTSKDNNSKVSQPV